MFGVPAPNPKPLSQLSAGTLLLGSLVVGEAMTALIVIGFSLLFRGEIAGDYLITGAVTCFVVALIVVGTVLHVLGHLRRTETQLVATKSERDSLQEQLFQAQKLEAIGQLAGGISHDFTNLLGAVIGNVTYLQTVSMDELAEGELDEVLDDIHAGAKRGATLSTQLLTFSRRQPAGTCSVAIADVVEAVVRLQKRTFDKAISLSTDVPTELCVLGDPAQLEQVIMNLCINARDAMPAGGELKISARRTDGANSTLEAGEYVEVTVRDTGEGMDAPTRLRAFEPFFTSKGPGQGTGLGLAVVYGIVKSHDGAIELRSQAGEGTSVVVWLPAAPVAASRSSAPTPVASSGGAARVLLVDDGAFFRRATERLLGQQRYEVVAVSGGAEAVAAVGATGAGFDAVLLDVAMPDMDGEATYNALREISADLPVVLMSGYDGGQRVERTLAAGAAGYIRKPFESAELAETLERAIEERPA